MELRRTNPLMPKVEGNRHATARHTPGMSLCGHDIPAKNRKGTDVNITNSMTFSRYLTRQDSVIPKKMHDNRYGIISPNRSDACSIETKWNILGTTSTMYADKMA